jgi:peptide/nickel transport system permease protein
MWTAKIVRLLVDTAVLIVLAAFIAGWLLRTAPGGEVDLRQADPRYSPESIARLKAERDATRDRLGRSADWFVSVLRGDFGRSETSGVPVADMLSERLPVTLRTVLIGGACGFVIAMALASFAPTVGVLQTAASAGFLTVLAIPSGLVALAAVFLRLPIEVAVTIAVAPRTFFYATEVFGVKWRSDWMLAAEAAGVARWRLIWEHLLPSAATEIAAVAGLALLNALAVTIPAEVLTGRPGVGQLAWQSAMERDLPVVLAVTLAMLLIARVVTLLSSLPPRQAGAAV